MHAIVSMNDILEISQSVKLDDPSDLKRRMIGILFLKPDSNLIAEEILKCGEYFHVRSGKEIDFFLSGYGVEYPEDPDNIFNIKVGDRGWVFSPVKFVSCIKEFHGKTSWRYSGETDLLLLDVIVDNDKGIAQFDFDNVISCNLDKLIRCGAIDSIHAFFEEIIKFVEAEKSEFPTMSFSDLMGLKKGKDGLIAFIRRMVPGDSVRDVEKILEFRTRSIESAT